MVAPKDETGDETADETANDTPTEELASSFIHVAWWQQDSHRGYAVYLPIELLDDGTALVENATPTALRDLVPYGVQCDLPEDTSSLTPPQFFIDPETGDPHIFFTNLGDCLFQIFQLRAQIDEGGEGDEGDGTTGMTKRRRHVIVFGNRFDATISPELEVDNANLEVGHGMSVVAWWESTELADDASPESATPVVRYLVMDGNGWAPIRSLPLNDEISRDQAVGLIRSLALR
jgi:hypothetical protein